MTRSLGSAVRSLPSALLVALLLGAILAVVYSPVVLGGKSLQAPLYTVSPIVPDGPWPHGGRRPAPTFDVDIATPAFYEWPIDHLVGTLLRRGELPSWNPHQGLGIPIVENYSTRVFFPFQMLLNMSPVGLWDLFFLLRLWIAGLFTALFLVRAGAGRPAASFGGVGYMLSGALVWFINLEQYANVAMVVPAWFLAVESFVTGPAGRTAAWVAVAVALILLAGQPEIAFYALVAGALYGVVRWTFGSPATTRPWRTIVWAMTAVVLGFAVAACQLLPFAAHLANALHLHPAGGDMGVRDPAPGLLAIQVLVPSFYELPISPRIGPDNGRWDWLGGYAGVLALFLSAAGLVVPPWPVRPAARAPLIFFTGVAAWIVLKNFGVPPFDWIGYLPLFDQVWTPRWGGPTWCFGLASASAFGLDRLLQTPVDRAARARLALVASGVLILLGLLAASGFEALAPIQDTHWSFIWPGAVGGLLLAFVVVGLAAVAVGRPSRASVAVVVLALLLIERWLPIPRGYDPVFLAARLVPVVIGLAAVATAIVLGKAGARILGTVAIAAAIVLDLLAPVGMPDRTDPAAPPPVVQFLRERAGHDRITGHRTVLAPNYASVFGLYDVRNVDALAVEWSHGYVTAALETEPRRWWHALWFTGEPERRRARIPAGASGVSPLEEDLRLRSRGYSLAGVRYIVTPRDLDLNRAAPSEGDRFPLVYDREVLVYENRAAFPRAFAVSYWESAPDALTARARALEPEFDPRTVAVVEGAAAGSGHEGSVTIGEYGVAHVRLTAEMKGPGLVVLTDAFYPGWNAHVDGRPTRIHRVDGVFRGVFVEGGSHEVVMRFRPASHTWGLGLSVAGLAVVVALLARAGRRG